jgi:L-seryl-tRNA(Ser) seleniumtransferase
MPEVRAAMDAASRQFVDLFELQAGVGKRLAALSGAESAMITSGSAGAMAAATAACIAGSDPENIWRLPDTTGLKSEVVMLGGRIAFDSAIRLAGGKLVVVKTLEELPAAIHSQTAMVYTTWRDDRLPKALEVTRSAKVPLLLDDAAGIPPFENLSRYAKLGVDLYCFSGGKGMRGPQCAGVLLGRKDLIDAALKNYNPYEGAVCRPMKVGKEEIMGMLAAVEMWKKRDHDAEWKKWQGWLDEIASGVKRVNGVTTTVHNPEGLSNRTPQLRIEWDADTVGITGQEVAKLLLDGEPRIVLAGGTGSRPDHMKSSVAVTPYMMMPGDYKVVAERLYAVLSHPPKFENPAVPQGELANVAGQWQAEITFLRGSANHTLVLEQHGQDLVGTHHGEFVSGDLNGKVTASQVHFHSRQRIQGQHLSYEFLGTVDGEKMSGTINMGEYGEAKFTAERHQYRTRA